MDSVIQIRSNNPESSTSNGSEAPTAGSEDANDRSAWNVGTSTQSVDGNKTKASNKEVVAIKIDDSDDSASDDDSSDTDHATAASAAQQMSQPAAASSSALPNIFASRQSCLTTWRNLPYKQTALFGTYALLFMALSDYTLHSIPTMQFNGKEDSTMNAIGYAAAYAGQAASIVASIKAYTRFEKKM